MKLAAFKELLLKKAEGNESLSFLIKSISQDFLADEIVESLEKMAESKGDRANSAITSFAGSATTPDTMMLHDAISHHLSHFAAANKANPPKIRKDVITQNYKTHEGPSVVQKTATHEVDAPDLHPVAAQHLERAMHLADLAAKSAKHSFGKLSFDHVHPHAWEMQRTGDHTRKNANGHNKYVDDQQGLKRRPKKDSKKFPDYGYLLMTPHDSYKDKGKIRGHQGQYPFEEMKINGKHVHIDHNLEAPKEFTPHEFDSHPLFSKEGNAPAWERNEDHRTDEHRNAYASALSTWHDSPQFSGWMARHKEMAQKDPAGYAKRGSEPSRLLEGVKKGEVERRVPAEKTQTAEQSKVPVSAQPLPKLQTKIRKEQKDAKRKEIDRQLPEAGKKRTELLNIQREILDAKPHELELRDAWIKGNKEERRALENLSIFPHRLIRKRAQDGNF